MERGRRPLSRKKKVVGGTAHVGRRPGAGPVGGGGPAGPGRSGGSSGSQRAGMGDLGDLANLVGDVMGASGGSGRRKVSWLPILIVVALLVFGGGGVGSLLGALGGGDGVSDLGADLGSGLAQSGGSASAYQTGTADASVAPEARAKRVALAGDGSDTTTVLVYLCGTDLESSGGFATKDLQEMVAADLSDQVHLLVFTGGCKRWNNSVVSAQRNQIYQIRDGGLDRQWEGDSLQPMTDPATLSGFIRWGVEHHPADRYELIFWDHGGGSLSGYGYDEAYPNAGSMTLSGIAQALKDGGCTFDFIGFDACLMATLETALVTEPYADYLIASEETEPGCGWYYTDWLNALSQDPSLPALDLGKRIADSFVSVCGQQARNQQATLSVVDLAELYGTVPAAFTDFAQAANRSIQTNDYQSIAAARSRTKEFAQSSDIDQVDLIHLADNIGTAESRRLAQVLRGAVKYNATSSNIQNANGLSVYFPYGRTSSVNTAAKLYGQIGLDPSYTDCIRSFASLEVAGQAVAGGGAGQMNSLFDALLGGSYSSGGDVLGSLLGDLLQGRGLDQVGLTGEEGDFLDTQLMADSVDYLAQNRLDPARLVWSQKDGQTVLALTQEEWDLVQDVALNVFVDDGEGYIDLGLDNVFDLNSDGDLLGEYDGTWLTVNGQVVAVYVLETHSETGETLAYIPAMLNGQRVDLMVSFAPDNEGEILGAAPRYDRESETATVARGLLELRDGDVIDFLCGYYDYDRTYQDDYYLGEPLTVDGPLVLANMAIDSADYVATYRLTDLYHNAYWTPAV